MAREGVGGSAPPAIVEMVYCWASAATFASSRTPHLSAGRIITIRRLPHSASVSGHNCIAGLLRPTLRTVEDARDFNRVFGHLIDGDIWQGRKHNLPPSRHAAAGSSKLGKILQAGASIIDGSGNPPGSFRVVALYPFANPL